MNSERQFCCLLELVTGAGLEVRQTRTSQSRERGESRNETEQPKRQGWTVSCVLAAFQSLVPIPPGGARQHILALGFQELRLWSANTVLSCFGSSQPKHVCYQNLYIHTHSLRQSPKYLLNSQMNSCEILLQVLFPLTYSLNIGKSVGFIPRSSVLILLTSFCTYMLMTPTCPRLSHGQNCLLDRSHGCLLDCFNSAYLKLRLFPLCPELSPDLTGFQYWLSLQIKPLLLGLPNRKSGNNPLLLFSPPYCHISLVSMSYQFCLLIFTKFIHFSLLLLTLARSGPAKLFFFFLRETDNNYRRIYALYSTCHNYSTLLVQHAHNRLISPQYKGLQKSITSPREMKTHIHPHKNFHINMHTALFKTTKK